MLKFEEYLNDFTNTINFGDFVINLLVATVLSLLLKWFYIRFGTSISNRNKFASIFVPLSLATMLVIVVVQSSIALSLGLVGALSIVRFRAAIKEPEELTYLFLAIGIGLVNGANKPLLAIVAVCFILLLIWVNSLTKKKTDKLENAMIIDVRSKNLQLSEMTALLSQYSDYLELKRMDQDKEGITASFIGKIVTLEKLSECSKKFTELDETASITIIDQPETVL